MRKWYEDEGVIFPHEWHNLNRWIVAVKTVDGDEVAVTPQMRSESRRCLTSSRGLPTVQLVGYWTEGEEDDPPW